MIKMQSEIKVPKIKRFFECLLPVTFCNLKCDYCYIIQEDRRKMQMPKLSFPVERIVDALTQKRVGGVCWFSICGAGETLAPREIFPIVKGLLGNGHYVNLTNNGTISQRIDQFCELPCDWRKRLHFAFSLHYIELKNRNLLQTFIRNVKKVRDAGCSFIVQINLYDRYMPVWQEIGDLCVREFGALPQVALTREETHPRMKIFSNKSDEEYIAVGKKFESPLFDFTVKNFNVKRKEFCYAGAWSGVLDLGSGILTGCYGDGVRQNIFQNLEEPIRFCPIGKGCRKPYCINSSHFLSLGVIPELEAPTYAALRNREKAGWYSGEMKAFLSQKLRENNEEYTPFQKFVHGIVWSRPRLFLRRNVLRLQNYLNRLKGKNG